MTMVKAHHFPQCIDEDDAQLIVDSLAAESLGRSLGCEARLNQIIAVLLAEVRRLEMSLTVSTGATQDQDHDTTT